MRATYTLKLMNIIITILQILLGLWNIIGGIYMSTHAQELINTWASSFFPSFFWIILGIIQILFSIVLLVSVGNEKLRKLAPISAIGLAVISLMGLSFYMSYDGFPGMLWGIIPAILLALIAYWRGSR